MNRKQTEIDSVELTPGWSEVDEWAYRKEASQQPNTIPAAWFSPTLRRRLCTACLLIRYALLLILAIAACVLLAGSR